MSVRWYSVVVDCSDVAAQAAWWAKVLGWQPIHEAADEVVVVPPHALTARDQELGPRLVFVTAPDGKTVKNRLHIDLAPRAADDHLAEVDRLIGLGATRVDIGQQDASWVVLADPEGNEFCVLTPRD